MSFPELLALAAALAMDALAVSIAAGITLGRPRPAQLLRMPLAFGLFQAAHARGRMAARPQRAPPH